ncbi:MAG: site-2 protease family protein [Archaeoglobaceae archaeon]|nr:site-2 protease family protein [Archaeoglobaceae archaeon]MDW8013615.1 site-2 protease family protein [Archaeoglobaceae archaeon]
MEILVALVFAIYWIIVEILKKKGILEKLNITAYGPLLMIRTSKLLNVIEKLSKSKSFWIIVAEFGFFTILAGMVFMMVLVVLVDYIMIVSSPEPSEYTSIRAALIIPGINPFIPLVWGLIGLIVTLIVHEFSHAILCRVEKIKVKSLGILLALVPIGGFAEPDEGELKKADRRSKLRVYSAGISANFITAFASFIIFLSLLSFVEPTVSIWSDELIGIVREVDGYEVNSVEDLKKNTSHLKLKVEKNGEKIELEILNVWGVKILSLVDGPAKNAGIQVGDVITAIDGKKVENFEDFRKILSEKKPYDHAYVEVYRKNEFITYELKLSEKDGRAFMGVVVSTNYCLAGYIIQDSRTFLDYLKSIPQLSLNPLNWFVLIAMPFNFQGFIGVYEEIFDAPEIVFYLLNTMYWIFWINFYVALFNCLPAIPLDGGRFFHEFLTKFVSRKIVDGVVKSLSLFIFFSILLTIIVPNV